MAEMSETEHVADARAARDRSIIRENDVDEAGIGMGTEEGFGIEEATGATTTDAEENGSLDGHQRDRDRMMSPESSLYRSAGRTPSHYPLNSPRLTSSFQGWRASADDI